MSAQERILHFCRLKRVSAESDKLQTPGRQRLALVRGEEAKTEIENPRAPDNCDHRRSTQKRQNSPRHDSRNSLVGNKQEMVPGTFQLTRAFCSASLSDCRRHGDGRPFSPNLTCKNRPRHRRQVVWQFVGHHCAWLPKVGSVQRPSQESLITLVNPTEMLVTYRAISDLSNPHGRCRINPVDGRQRGS